MISNLLETDNDVETILAIHHKHTIFKDSGYYTFNRVIFQMPATISTPYLSGLSCITHDVGEQAVTEDFRYHNFTKSSGLTIAGNGRKAKYFNSTTKLGAEIESKIISPSSYDQEALIQFQDVEAYCKFYRYVANKEVLANDVWEGEMTVKFYKR